MAERSFLAGARCVRALPTRHGVTSREFSRRRYRTKLRVDAPLGYKRNAGAEEEVPLFLSGEGAPNPDTLSTFILYRSSRPIRPASVPS